MLSKQEVALLAAFRQMNELQQRIALASFQKIAPPMKQLPDLKLVSGGRR